MALVVKEGIMEDGDVSIDVDYTPELYALLWDAYNQRPHTLFMQVRDDDDDSLLYPPFVLRRIDGDERGLTIGGPGIGWTLGKGDTGPTIVEREYLSGADMLSNGSFTLDDLYWRRPSEGSLWQMAHGVATNLGGLHTDDVLEYDLPFPARPGNEYVATAVGAYGEGNLRVRIIFTGRFNPPNLITNGDFELGAIGWTSAANIAIVAAGARNGAYAMRISPIPKPQLVVNGDFSAGSSGWTLPATFSVLSGGLIASPNVQPQYIADPHFETLAGWTDVLGPVDRPMSDDIDIVSDGTNARTGVGVMRVGPVTQHQVFANADFGSGFANWFASSTAAEPDWTWWYLDPTEGNNGTPCARTIGWSTAGYSSGPTIKYLRADFTNGGGVEPYPVKPGESYRLEGYVKFAPGSEGIVYISLMFPHPTVPNHDTWMLTDKLDGVEHADMRWNRLAEDITVPANRFSVYCLCEVHNQGLGYTYFDTVTLTRTRGNRAQINSDATYEVIPDTRYQLSAVVRSGDNMSGGNVRIGVILTGDGVDPLVIDTDRGNTDFEWTRVTVEVRPPTGYTTAQPFVAGLDITGDPVWLDVMTFTKVENNSDTATGTPFDVTPDQRYILSADVTSIGATRGEIAVGVRLSGDGMSDQDVEVKPSTLDDLKTKSVSIEVRPPQGYTVGVPYVRSTDVEGGVFAIDRIQLIKADNNSDSTTGTVMVVTPERTYRWTQPVWFDASLERGNVRLGVRCTRAGHDAETFYSSPMDKGEAGSTWQTLTFDFTPPSGYDRAYPIVVGTDTEAGYVYLDDGQIRDTDTTTVVYDVVTTDPWGVSPSVTAVAPDGTESVRVAVLVETDAAQFTVGAVSLVRTDLEPATGDEIVADMLVDPVTGDPLSIGAGDIDCPEFLDADWHIVNLHNRDALDHYCKVLSNPPREWRITATDPPRLDCKERSALFVDHAPDHPTAPVVLVDAHIKDPDVEEMDPPEVDVTDRPSEIKVIGAERELVGGGTMLISATADVPGDVERGYNNLPMVRTQIVSSGTIDHQGYAGAYAADLAERAANPPLAVSIILNEIDDDTAAALGIDARPAYDVGDWIYAYKPTAGLLDEANETTINGAAVFPMRVRVLDRERSHGPGVYVTMRRPDGSTFPLPGINYGVDRTALTVGDRLPEWVVDPQGKAEGVQYVKDRASRPR